MFNPDYKPCKKCEPLIRDIVKEYQEEYNKLKEYAQHKDDCDVKALRYGETLCECTCGLKELLEGK